MRFTFLDRTQPIELLYQRLLETRWQSVTLVGFTIFALLASLYAIGAVRLRSAMDVDSRAQTALQESRLALRQSQTASNDVRLWEQRAEKLRILRLSGTNAALRVAELGDKLPKDVWLTEIANGDTSFEVRAETPRLQEVAPAFDAIATGARSAITISVDRRRSGSDLEFDISSVHP